MHLVGRVIFEWRMQHGSGAGVESPGSIPCTVVGWEVGAGCCLSPASLAVASLQSISDCANSLNLTSDVKGSC